ncbi:unnamed protein product [Leptosia nina]|uniref:BESS domain-containing protein n=1 Tax=Leptosia nina TaxID=320188 RepID=A0AAV1K0K6_9NEOP
MNKKQQSPKAAEEDADTKFLLSLLPQIKSLNERQNWDVSPPMYQVYTTNTNSASSYSTIQSPESIETQIRPIQSAETETAHSIEEIDEIFQNRST